MYRLGFDRLARARFAIGRTRACSTAGLLVAGVMIAVASPATAQMITQPVRAPQPITAQTPPGIATVPAPPALAPAIPTKPSAGISTDVTVEPVRRVAPKTPPLPTIVAKAIAKVKPVKVAAKRGATPSATLAPPMALGAASAATSNPPTARVTLCQPGETFVRRTGVCQKRGVAAPKAKAVAAPKPKKVAKAKAVAVKSKSRT